RLHAAGNITQLQLDLERAQYEEARLALSTAEYDVLARRESLNALMGLQGEMASLWEAPARLPPLPPQGGTTRHAGELEAGAIEQSVELQALRQEIETA